MKFYFVAILAALLCSCGSRRPQSVSSDSIHGSIDGIYYGLTNDTLGVKNPWVFYLNTAQHKGASYNNYEELSNVKIDSDGHVSFQANDMERSFTFSGMFQDGIIDGQLLCANKVGALPLRLTAVHLSKNDFDSNYGEIYSNYHYVEEAGDESGEEFLMLPGASEPIIVFGMAEGDFEGPFHGINVSRKSDTVAFTTANLAYAYSGKQDNRAVRSDIGWRAELSKRRLVLDDVDQTDLEFKYDTLKRTETLDHLLKRIAFRRN